MAIVGAIGLKDGGGGNEKPANGGVDVCKREGGREDGCDERVGTSGGLDGPAPGVLEGVDECATSIDARSEEMGDVLVFEGGGIGFVDPIEPNSKSRSLPIAPEGELIFNLALDALLAALIGRSGGGAFGGGANGGGKTGTTDSGFALTNFSSASVASWSASSLALGTMSDRNSRSSEDSARELRGLPPPPRRENRLRNLETAEGAGGVAERSTTGSGAEL